MFKKLMGALREFKPVYIAYNFLHRRKLQHNKSLYRRFGIQKPLYWTVSSADFSRLPQQAPWLDRAAALTDPANEKKLAGLDPLTRSWIEQWVSDGAVLVRGFIDPAKAAAVNAEIVRLTGSGKLRPLDNGKIMFAFRQSPLIRELIHDARLLDFFEFIFGQPALPFQTINFIHGSQQAAHSDSVHMTTYPLGYLAAAWWALEKVDDANGPLFYYPGSHRLPYILRPDFDRDHRTLRLDPHSNEHYEQKIAEIIAKGQLTQKVFHAAPGDLFLWHANLLHGGSPILDPARTRRSMVAHYFARDVIKYHEISERPALISPDDGEAGQKG